MKPPLLSGLEKKLSFFDEKALALFFDKYISINNKTADTPQDRDRQGQRRSRAGKKERTSRKARTAQENSQTPCETQRPEGEPKCPATTLKPMSPAPAPLSILA
jgi:hypothetical protein